jgi:hypothetical protein
LLHSHKALVEAFEEEIIDPADRKFSKMEMERASALAEEL